MGQPLQRFVVEDSPFMRISDLGIRDRDVIHAGPAPASPHRQLQTASGHSRVPCTAPSGMTGPYRDKAYTSNSSSSSPSLDQSDVPQASKYWDTFSGSDVSAPGAIHTDDSIDSSESRMHPVSTSSATSSSDSRGIVLNLLHELTEGRPVGVEQAINETTANLSAGVDSHRAGNGASWRLKRRNRFLPSLATAGGKKRPANAVHDLFNSDLMDSIEWQSSEARRKRIVDDGTQARLDDIAAELAEQYELTDLLPAKYGNIILRPIDFDAELQELMDSLKLERMLHEIEAERENMYGIVEN